MQMHVEPSTSSITSSSHPSAFAARHSHLPRDEMLKERKNLIKYVGGEFEYSFNKYMTRERSPEKLQRREENIEKVEKIARDTIR